MLYSKAAGPGDSSPSPSTYHILGSSRHGFAHLYYIVGVQFLQLFLPVFAVFLPILHHFPHFWPPGPTCRAEPAAGTQKQGPGARAGRQRRPRRPVAAAAPRGPPGPERRRRERRGEPRRPGAREPGAERPPGGQPGRSGQRGSASTVEGTAGPGRRDRLPRTPGGPDRRRGGRRVGVAARAASGRAAPQGRPPAKKGRGGNRPDRPHTAIAVGPALRGAEASRWVPPRPERSGGSGGRVPAAGPRPKRRRQHSAAPGRDGVGVSR